MVKASLFDQLEALGEDEVRRMLAMGKMGAPGNDHRNAVESWLVNKERKRAEAREDEALSISRRALLISAEANDISRSARRWAITAMLVSAVTAIVAAGITAYVQYISSGP